MCAHQIAFNPLAGQNGLTLQGARPRKSVCKLALRGEMQGSSLRTALHCGADGPEALEQLCLHITCLALANKRVQCRAAGQEVPKPDTFWLL